VHVRVAPRARRRGLTAWLVFVCSLSSVGVAGCGRAADPSDSISVSWTLDPAPPVAGAPMVARLTLRDATRQPLTGARLRLEGLMSHPGMAPVTAEIVERDSGTYEAQMQFSMAGDWILLVTGQLADGTSIKKQIEIAGVRPAS
jgi:hypothetical protein